MNRRRSAALGAVAVSLSVAATLSSCGDSQSPIAGVQGDWTSTSVPLPQAEYRDVAWLPFGLAMVIDDPQFAEPSVVERFSLAGEPLGVVRAAQDRCRVVDVYAPARLPEGDLGAIQQCVYPPDDESFSRSQVIRIRGDRIEPIFRAATSLDLTEFTMSSASGRVIASEGSGVCGSLVELSERGSTTISVDTPGLSQLWNLADAFPRAGDCTDPFLADEPIWDPSGKELAFVLHPTSPPTLSTIYVWRPDDPAAQQLVGGFSSISDIAWSPDGATLAVAGVRDEQPGIWLLDRADPRLQLIHVGFASGIDWDPTGDAIVALSNLDPESTMVQILNQP